MFEYPLELDLRTAPEHFERVYIDNSILSETKPKKMSWGRVCGFSDLLGKADSFHDLSSRILYQQEKKSKELAKIISQSNYYSTDEIIAEYECFINHIERNISWLRGNSRRGNKQELLENILHNYNITRNKLLRVPSNQRVQDFLQRKRLHLPRVRELTKITNSISIDCSEADASLVSAAICFQGSSAILTHDMDICNLVYNAGLDLREQGLTHNAVVYFLRPEHYKFNFDFSADANRTYAQTRSIPLENISSTTT